VGVGGSLYLLGGSRLGKGLFLKAGFGDRSWVVLNAFLSTVPTGSAWPGLAAPTPEGQRWAAAYS